MIVDALLYMLRGGITVADEAAGFSSLFDVQHYFCTWRDDGT